jgi:hypothetical protein
MMAPPRSQVQGEVVVVEPLKLELLNRSGGTVRREKNET